MGVGQHLGPSFILSVFPLRVIGTHLDQTSALLLEEHDVETIKVGKVPPLFGSLALLSPRRLLPLGDNLGSVEDLLNGRSTRGTGELLENVRGEDESSVSEGLAGDTSRGTVDESLINSMIR